MSGLRAGGTGSSRARRGVREQCWSYPEKDSREVLFISADSEFVGVYGDLPGFHTRCACLAGVQRRQHAVYVLRLQG